MGRSESPALPDELGRRGDPNRDPALHRDDGNEYRRREMAVRRQEGNRCGREDGDDCDGRGRAKQITSVGGSRIGFGHDWAPSRRSSGGGPLSQVRPALGPSGWVPALDGPIA
ncbi:hypothetical protein MILUP08_42663 [Micromonospora lupini str. Lupac 08]|uniref:Uncharacterized protein n=1 Tax=Micromonospora lupini str. Lupac 08 TaxID=1150864 RepID=I0L1N5_9ACTN|nr:hypothetical protein MILUP08_42663 [Micromonospora lupini str. Lupac 08]